MIIVDQCPGQRTLNRLTNRLNGIVQDNSRMVWPDVAVCATYSKLSHVIPESSFSIFTLNTPGEVLLGVGNRKLKVFGQSMGIIHPYESLTYVLDSDVNIQVLNLHFSIETFHQLTDNLTRNHAQLLDAPWEFKKDYPFLNQLYFYKNIHRKKLTDFSVLNHDEYLLNVTDVLLQLCDESYNSSKKISFLKQSTRNELLKRVSRARDIIYSNYNDPELTIDYLCQEVSMSKFHFIRVFKQVYSYTLHKLIQQIRVKRAVEYLKNSSMSMREIALNVGFQETNSIYPLLRGYRTNEN